MKKIWIFILSLIVLCPFVNAEFLNLSEIELVKYYGPINLIIDMHFEIWQGKKNDDQFSYYINLLRDVSQYSDFDIVSYLKTSIDIDSSLQYVLDHLFQLITKSNTAINALADNMSVFEQTKSECDEQKISSDKNYTLALKDLDAYDMEKYLSESIENDRCASEARINYNAYKKLQSQLVYYRDVLKMKYDYFLEHKYDIIQNMSRKVK